MLPQLPQEPEGKDPRQFATFLATRPVRYEKDAIATLLQVLLKEHASPAPGFVLHIAHLGDAGSLAALEVTGPGASLMATILFVQQFDLTCMPQQSTLI